MERMAQWAVVLPPDRWATERLFHHDIVTVAVGAGTVAPDDEVLVVGGGAVVALARAVKAERDDLVLTYLRRSFDEPVAAAELGLPADVERAAGSKAVVWPVAAAGFARVAGALSGSAGGAGTGAAVRTTWLVSVALPIEAVTPADAVRQFWSHVQELGPVELPTYVWPSGDELAMQAFVLGDEANQDPEEEDDP
jgi:hypothetical protein